MGFVLAIVVWSLMISSVVLLKLGFDARTSPISEAARGIDSQFLLTLILTGIIFVLAQGLLGYYVFKYRGQRSGLAKYLHGNTKIEAGGAILCGIIFMSLAVLGQKVWMQLHLADAPKDILQVEVTGEQFAWNVRYPGVDGKFGKTHPSLYDPARNPLGIDPKDPAGRDDIVLLNKLVVPVSQPVQVLLRAKDVLHSFYMPSLRIKQDTVPGLKTSLRFKADETGDYEIACAELCGLGHYRMRGSLEIVEPEAYADWLAQQASEIERQE